MLAVDPDNFQELAPFGDEDEGDPPAVEEHNPATTPTSRSVSVNSTPYTPPKGQTTPHVVIVSPARSIVPQNPTVSPSPTISDDNPLREGELWHPLRPLPLEQEFESDESGAERSSPPSAL
jgi:hypothetical protein